MFLSEDDYQYISDYNIIYFDPIEDIVPGEPIKQIVQLEQYNTYEMDNFEGNKLPFIELIPLEQNEPFEHIEPDEFYKYIKWPKKILKLKMRDLNIYFKNNKLNTEQIKSIKIQRRRMNNRKYSRTYRARKH